MGFLHDSPSSATHGHKVAEVPRLIAGDELKRRGRAAALEEICCSFELGNCGSQERPQTTFDAHRLISQQGVEMARRAACTKLERACVDAAAAIRSKPSNAGDIVYAGPEAVCLPHRRLDGRRDGLAWTRNIGSSSYRLESGLGNDGAPAGVPFGSKARLLLIYLHDAAVRSGSPIIDVGAPMRAWLRRLSGETGGMTKRCLGDQLVRIAACNAAIVEENLPPRFVHHGPFIDKVLRRDRSGAPEWVLLNESYNRYAGSRSIALRLTALSQIRDNGWAIDLYAWLSFQLPRLNEPLSIDWRTFVLGFDSGYKHGRQMKATSVSCFPLVKAVYPEARIEVTEKHLVLYPSPPPIRTPATEQAS